MTARSEPREPTASRPHMPGYGISTSATGLIPWAEAERKLIASTNYWVATVSADGTPHLMPLWGIWHDGLLWFSSGGRSRKVRNLAAAPRCTVSIEDSQSPVVVTGVATITTDIADIRTFIEVANAKYAGGFYSEEFLDPATNATVKLTPEWAFALKHDDFAGSPTRWTFAA
jgi:general stress protein 26